MSSRTFQKSLAALGLLAFVACGGGDSPAANTPPPTTQPTPVPTPTPPQPLPQRGLSCGLSYGDPTGSCERTSPEFLAQYERAIDMVYAQHPEIINFNSAVANGAYQILSPGHYLLYLLENLEAQNLCADFPVGSEEIQIKNSQAFHEQWDPMAGGHVRRGENSYRATCTPAGFPIQEPPRFPVPGCRIGASRSFWCQREGSSLFIGAVLGAREQMFRTHPEFFDFSNTQRGTDWPLVLNTVAFENGMKEILQQQGYCVVVDLELGIKNSNDVSETFDILTSSFHARGDDGSYRSTCVPADF